MIKAANDNTKGNKTNILDSMAEDVPGPGGGTVEWLLLDDLKMGLITAK